MKCIDTWRRFSSTPSIQYSIYKENIGPNHGGRGGVKMLIYRDILFTF